MDKNRIAIAIVVVIIILVIIILISRPAPPPPSPISPLSTQVGTGDFSDNNCEMMRQLEIGVVQSVDV